MIRGTSTQLRQLVELFPDNFGEGFDPEEWLEEEGHVMLTDGDDNYSLFEEEAKGTFSGHYYLINKSKNFNEKAQIAKDMIQEMFDNRGAKSIIGRTPVNNKAALRMTTKLGFTPGFVQVRDGSGQLCNFSFMNKQKG